MKIAFIPQVAGPVDLQRSLLLYLAQLKQDASDSRTALIDRLAQDLWYRCSEIEDMLRCTGALRRELENLSAS